VGKLVSLANASFTSFYKNLGGIQGYISEKIFVAPAATSVPLCVGGNNQKR
jgi:hypothetical protein